MVMIAPSEPPRARSVGPPPETGAKSNILRELGRTIRRDVHALVEAADRAPRSLAEPEACPVPGTEVEHRPTRLRHSPVIQAGTVPRGRPVRGRTTSRYGMRRHPIHHERRMHYGEDIAAPAGTPVHATAAGRVTRAGRAGSYGNLVEIDHGGGLVTRYAHLSAVAVVVGAPVEWGEMVGTVGATGAATGPNLHYEVLRDGVPQDPREYGVGGMG